MYVRGMELTTSITFSSASRRSSKLASFSMMAPLMIWYKCRKDSPSSKSSHCCRYHKLLASSAGSLIFLPSAAMCSAALHVASYTACSIADKE